MKLKNELPKEQSVSRFRNFMPAGVIPATLIAFHADYSIDEISTRKHLNHVCKVSGITGVTMNGHA